MKLKDKGNLGGLEIFTASEMPSNAMSSPWKSTGSNG